MLLTDSHCHLTHIDTSLDEVLMRAKKAGVEYFLNPGVVLEDTPKILKIMQKYPNVYGSIAVHPSELVEFPTLEELCKQALLPEIVAIGETGLDFKDTDLLEQNRQCKLLELHLEAARLTNKPVILHLRQAGKILLSIIKKYKISGIVHCFTEDWDIAKQFLDLGFLLSFSGIITFKNSEALREVFKKVPINSILIETDSPYLAPAPFRGKDNEPAYIKYIAQLGADLKQVSIEFFANETTNNFLNFVRGA